MGKRAMASVKEVVQRIRGTPIGMSEHITGFLLPFPNRHTCPANKVSRITAPVNYGAATLRFGLASMRQWLSGANNHMRLQVIRPA